MRRAVAVYRSPAYSPQQHLTNDRAILDATVDELAPLGWDVARVDERDLRGGHLPTGRLYLNMCQGVESAARLRRLLPRGAVSINTPSAVQACHRHHLIPHLRAAGLPVPRTVFVPTSGSAVRRPPVELVTDNGYPVWVKRGDVHAETPDDVVAAAVERVGETMQGFAARGVSVVALQEHLPGPVVKFYGVAPDRFFHWYAANGAATPVEVDVERLRGLAETAAKVLGLAVYGGDAVVRRPEAPVLIDVNDWPSFAPVRNAAAAAIAHLAHERAVKDRYLCSTH
jgi:hypothetical protein